MALTLGDRDDLTKYALMSSSAALFRRLAGALLFASLWLTALQGTPAAYEASRFSSSTITPAELNYLLTDQQPATLVRAATVESSATPGSRDGSSVVPQVNETLIGFTSEALRTVPAARAPPLSKPLHNFQARAPPIA